MTDWTPRLANLYARARALQLDDPFGRAVYALNRAYNCGGGHRGVERFLLAAKPETAARWREHWENGGHPKSLTKFRKGFTPGQRVALPRRAISFTSV